MTLKRPFIYLASQSARRRDILSEMGIEFEIVPSTYHEEHDTRSAPKDLALRHAVEKARRAVLPENAAKKNAFVLGADTVVVFEGACLGKPENYEEAETWIRKMSGKKNTVMTAIVLIDLRTGIEKTAVDTTNVFFKKWSDREIADYVRKIDALDKAGAYAIQSEPCIVESWSGSFTNVVGLPKEALTMLLDGFNVPQ